MEKYCVYEHISPSGKRYIGLSKDYIKRWGNKGYNYRKQLKFYRAIMKYGWDNFKHNIIATNLTKEEAEILEIKLIERYDCIKNGYNVAKGGNGTNAWSQEMKQKASQSHKGKQIWWIGRKHSEKTKEKMSQSHKGKTTKYVICKETGKFYNSVKEAAMDLNLALNCASNISRVINNPNRTAYGYHWIR